jgi:hypothetical protein
MFTSRRALFVALCVILLTDIGLTQVTQVALRSIAVKGTLLCGKKPAENVKVRLFRVSSDDVKEALDTRTTGPSGMFDLTGNTNGRPVNETELTPVVKFYHKCDEDDKKKGFRRFQLSVPREFVTLGKAPKRTFDVGTLNLELNYPKEGREKEFKEI